MNIFLKIIPIIHLKELFLKCLMLSEKNDIEINLQDKSEKYICRVERCIIKTKNYFNNTKYGIMHCVILVF